jgi:hypothetical protein
MMRVRAGVILVTASVALAACSVDIASDDGGGETTVRILPTESQ